VKVALLHAFPLDERMWEPQRQALFGFDVAAPRLYGLGNSIEGWAKRLLAEIDGELVAVGASMGGYCALAMARQAPERLRGLVLAGSRAGPDSAERRRMRDETIQALREKGVENWYADSGSTAPAEFVFQQSADDLIAASEALRDRPDASETLASFNGPILVAVGDQDDLLSVDEAQAMVDSAQDARLEVFPGAAHLLTLEEPERFNRVLGDFLSRWK
jgi:pimeloyl-ACP methyl ester carboxylesterase